MRVDAATDAAAPVEKGPPPGRGVAVETDGEQSVIETTLASDSLSVADVLAVSFPSPDLCSAAAAAFRRTPIELHEGPSFFLEVAPGLVQLRATDLARAERTDNRNAERPVIPPSDGPSTREVTAWSRKSRANMVRAMSAADWSPVFAGGMPVMVTLTYPGEWLPLAPDGRTAKRHLDAFRRAYLRKWGRAVTGAWKLEFQRRGAPHFHLMVPAPGALGPFAAWCSVTWAAIVDREALSRGHDQGDEQRRRHLLAGTGVDVATGARMRDPRRVAVYFLKHGVKSHDGKAYQNDVPSEWSQPGHGPGRFWGLWGVRVTSARVHLTPDEFVTIRRTLRRWASSNNRRLFHTGRLQGGWAGVNDGPAFAWMLSRLVT